MHRSPLGLAPSIESYLNAQVAEHPVLAELHQVTLGIPYSQMQIAPSQGAFMSWLLRLIGAKRTIEVGVYTGYSSLVTALALPADGRILACDVNEEWTQVARQHWKKAGVEQKIELVLAPATETLLQRIRRGESNSYDFAFIDADKENYEQYFEHCLRLVRPGGVLMFDNTLWGGSVTTSQNQAPTTKALRELNRKVLVDTRVSASLIPVGDGLLLATKL